MNELSRITLLNIEHIADVRDSLSRLEERILSEKNIVSFLSDLESKVHLLRITATSYQDSL